MNKTLLADTLETINLSNIQKQGIKANETLSNIIGNTFTIVIVIATVLVLAYLIWGAIQWIISGGDKEKVGSARKTIINALIGLAILALAFFIVRIVGDIVGINVIGNFDIPRLGAPANATP